MGMFRSRLAEWTAERFGHLPARQCYLSLYINGCRQGQHNDAANGRFGYVYSLTKDDRRSIGGETLIWNEENYFESRMHQPAVGSGVLSVNLAALQPFARIRRPYSARRSARRRRAWTPSRGGLLFTAISRKPDR